MHDGQAAAWSAHDDWQQDRGETGPGRDGGDDVLPAGDAPAGPGLRACVEAILLVADEPVAENLLAQIVERPTE
jgi:hypothetical protein